MPGQLAPRSLPARISGSEFSHAPPLVRLSYSPNTAHRAHFSHVVDTFTDKLAQGTSKGRYAFVSLGCPKNLVDSERMLGLLQLDGYELVNDPKGADFAVVNT